ncbi:MAG: hypothetical protein ACM3S2_11340 [Ignavibacteriales bacterium]
MSGFVVCASSDPFKGMCISGTITNNVLSACQFNFPEIETIITLIIFKIRMGLLKTAENIE